MGLLKSFGGNKKEEDWNRNQQSSKENTFGMSDPNLKGMAVGDTKAITSLSPITKLHEVRVELEEKEAEDWREQKQLHGRLEAAKTSILDSHAAISETQFTHGQRRIKRGLKAREKTTRFGEYLFSQARPEFVSQNLQVQLSQKAGENKINRLEQIHQDGVDSFDSYERGM